MLSGIETLLHPVRGVLLGRKRITTNGLHKFPKELQRQDFGQKVDMFRNQNNRIVEVRGQSTKTIVRNRAKSSCEKIQPTRTIQRQIPNWIGRKNTVPRSSLG